jgi:FkbM family methyltransferase
MCLEPMMFLSYAQNFEDVILRRVLHDVAHGFFVDVGAHDPDFMSLTKAFSEMGWRGINIEPSSTFQKFPAARPNDINLNCAVSDHDGTATLHEYPDGPGLSRLDSMVTEIMKPHTGHVITQTVPIRTLASILEEHAPAQVVDFLSIDVEGHERAVLSGNDWQRFRPRVIVIEATETLTNKPTHHLWDDILRDARYVFAYFDGLNRFYVRVEDAQLLPRFGLPPNVFDEFTPARVHQLDLQVQELHGHIVTWKAAHDNAVSQATQVARTLASHQGTIKEWEKAHDNALGQVLEARSLAESERVVAEDWKTAHDNAVSQVVEARAEIELLKIQSQQLHEANKAACENLEQAATELERQYSLLRESHLSQAGLRSQVDQVMARNEMVIGQLAELGAELNESKRQVSEQSALVSEYRGLCRETSGRSLKIGLWFARVLSALRMKPRPPYPV